MTLATSGLFAARWTDQIHDEWIRNLVAKRPELEAHLDRTRGLMNSAVPDCIVTGYETLIDGLDLPDPDDRHVLAAAIRCSAQIIVTNNLKDFPSEKLDPYGIEAMTPDDFVECQLGLRPDFVVKAAKLHRGRLRCPPKTAEEYLDTLSAQGLIVTADFLRDYKDLI